MQDFLADYERKHTGLTLDGALPLLRAVEALRQAGGRSVVAIDGPCGSGKTTLGALLGAAFDCQVFSLDSFFLRPEQRTEQRLAEPGGNIDYERAEAELFRPLRAGEAFSYRPYDCAKQALSAPVPVTPGALSIVEGAYSLHPRLAGYADLKVFLTVDAQTRARRLQARGAALYARFVSEWIPKETLYFETFRVAESCDLVLNGWGGERT